jgi:ABC-2 type transport system ATP-binding protein
MTAITHCRTRRRGRRRPIAGPLMAGAPATDVLGGPSAREHDRANEHRSSQLIESTDSGKHLATHDGVTADDADTDARGAAHPDPVVTIRALSKRYGPVVAVEDLTFALDRGTVTGFLGPNGAGKSTTLRLLLDLAEPTTGEALVFGRRYRELEQPARRVGAVLESNDFHPARSGRNHLRVLALAAQIPSARVEEVLNLVELSDAADRRVKTYSLGMRQRLGLAGALLGEPELLILDEPANGLDPVGVHWLRGFLRRFAKLGSTAQTGVSCGS